MRALRYFSLTCVLLSCFALGMSLPWVHAQTGGPVIVTGRDPVTKSDAVAVGNTADQSIRTHVVGTNPPLRPTPALVVGPLGNVLTGGLSYAPVPVVIAANRYGDPCAGAKGNIAISQTANAVLHVAFPGHILSICSVLIVGADAENVSIVEGTGATCGTGTTAVIGGATAANGPNLAANGGFAGGGSNASIAVLALASDDVCLYQSGSGRVAGNITFAYTP